MLLPDLSRQHSRTRQFFTWLGVIVVIALIFGWKPLVREIKRHRADSLAQQGELLFNERKGDAAYDKFGAALQIDGANLQANYGMAKLLTAAGRGDAFKYWTQVFSDGGGTDNDRIAAAVLAFRFKKNELVGKYLNPVLAREPVPLEAVRFAAIFADSQNQEAEVTRFAQAYLQSNPKDGDMSLLLARHYQASANPQLAAQAKPLLFTALHNGDSNSFAEALGRLSQIPNLTTNEVNELLAVLTKLPTNDATTMLRMQLQAHATPEAKEMITARVLSESGQSPEKLKIACRWLSQQGELRDLLKILPADNARQDRELFELYTDALSRSGLWAELDAFLNTAPLPIDPIQQKVFLARTAMQLTNAPSAQLRWQEALTMAGTNPDALKYIANYAELIGAADRALQAYQTLTRDPTNARAGYEGMIRIADRERDTVGLRNLMRTMVELYPADPAPQNDLAYLNLLLNNDVPASVATAEKLVRDDPALPAYRATLALGRLRQNNPAGALKAYEGIKFYIADCLPSWIAVYTAVIGANGQAENARALAASLPLGGLKPEELKLVQPWLPGVKPATMAAPVKQ